MAIPSLASQTAKVKNLKKNSGASPVLGRMVNLAITKRLTSSRFNRLRRRWFQGFRKLIKEIKIKN